MSWEMIDDFTVYVCNECGNDIIICINKNPPDKCPYCTGKKVSNKDMLKILAIQLYGSGHCIPDFNPSICNKNYTATSPDGCVTCWIAWAEEKIKNGT